MSRQRVALFFVFLMVGWLCAAPVVAAAPASSVGDTAGVDDDVGSEADSTAIDDNAPTSPAFDSLASGDTADTGDATSHGHVTQDHDDEDEPVDHLVREPAGSVGFDTPLGVDSVGTDTAASLSTGDSPLQASSQDEIRLTTTLDRTPSRVGTFTATLEVRIPDRVTELTARLPEDADVQRTRGFSRDSGTSYTWDGNTSRPTITYEMPADQRANREGPLADDGRLLFTETSDWALVRIPQASISGRYTGTPEPALNRRTQIDGSGAAGERIAFLGEHTVRTHRAHGQTFRLVVPEDARLRESPSEIFSSLASASDRLRVGDRDSEVFAVAAPSRNVNWAVRGLQTGSADMWVQDSERLADPANVWVHEYVHTRQDYRAAEDFQWFTEATATYYAALLTLEEGRIDFEQFAEFMRRGEGSPQASARLTRPSTWENFAEYRKGALVSGEIDRQIRVASNGEASFDDVFADANSHSGEMRARDFERSVGNAGDSAVRDEATRYTTTSDVPRMWNSEAHAEAFGGLDPARFSFTLADSGVSVSGPDREETLGDDPFELAVNETLRVTMEIQNVGETAGDYTLTFRVNDSETPHTGRLEPGASETHQFSQTFTDPGEYVVSVGDETFTVVVGEDESDSDAGLIGDAPEPPDIDVDAPGFGVVTAATGIAALLALLVAGRFRRH